jgi:hypothetical protein
MGKYDSITSMACDGANPIEIISKPSPWFSNTTIDPKFIVLHCIGFNDRLEILVQYHVRAHYLVPQQTLGGSQFYALVMPRYASGMRGSVAG